MVIHRIQKVNIPFIRKELQCCTITDMDIETRIHSCVNGNSEMLLQVKERQDVHKTISIKPDVHKTKEGSILSILLQATSRISGKRARSRSNIGNISRCTKSIDGRTSVNQNAIFQSGVCNINSLCTHEIWFQSVVRFIIGRIRRNGIGHKSNVIHTSNVIKLRQLRVRCRCGFRRRSNRLLWRRNRDNSCSF